MVKLFIYYVLAFFSVVLAFFLTICVFSLVHLFVLLPFYVFSLKDHATRQIHGPDLDNNIGRDQTIILF
jgi:hypothetical protein